MLKFLYPLAILVLLGAGSPAFAGKKEVGPGGITPGMTAQEVGRRASLMSSQEIGKAIVYLKAKSGKAGAKKKADIEALIRKLEGKKKTREVEERAKADYEEKQKRMKMVSDDDELEPTPPAATPTAVPASK